MAADLIVRNIGTLWTPKTAKSPARGKEMTEVLEIKNAFLAVKDGVILDMGEGDGASHVGESTIVHDAQGDLVTPGLVDSHTHVVHYGSREYEFEKKMRGVPYLKILEEGGGILSSVRATREATPEELYRQSKQSLDTMLRHGVTTVEGKSGYGLDMETELKQLRVQKTLDADHPVDIVPTFLGAHALPGDFKNDRMSFLERVVDMMGTVREEGLAEFVDIFCEKNVFDVEESRYILSEAKKRGFGLKIHADEIEPLGGVELACELGAASADHLMVITDEGIAALKDSDTVANVLPSTSFYLGSDYAPVRKMLQEGVALAVSSDYNPGSSPSENFLFTLNIAAIHLKMSPQEILNASTRNAAHSVKRADRIGVLEKGMAADFVIYDAQNFPYVLYHFAINHVRDVFKNGRLVVHNKQCVWEDTT